MRFSTEPGDGNACANTVEEQVEDYWSNERGQGELFEGIHNKVEPDVDTAATEAALDRLLANGVERDIPRAEGHEALDHQVGENLKETQQFMGVQSALRWTRIRVAGVP